MKDVVLFCHIEKCAGTSFIKKCLQEWPLKSVGILTKGNLITLRDVENVKRLYGRPRIISGHSITPGKITDFSNVFHNVSSFTIFREPYSRLISNYLHDKTRGVWDGTLADYVSISWKQNYMLRFLGSGDIEKGYQGFEKLDFKISVRNLSRSLPFLISELDLPLRPSLKKRNSFEQNKSVLPEDLVVKNGVQIGRYSISLENHALIGKLNKRDIEFYDMALETEEKWLSNLEKLHVSGQYFAKPTSSFLIKVAWVYRNLIYKPYALKKLGPHRLPRNAVSPSLIGHHDAF